MVGEHEAEYTFYGVADVAELPNGERLYLEIDGQPVVVFNIAGYYYAISDVCTHDMGPLGDGEVEEHEIVCPRHGARFDVRTGEAKKLPAVEGIAAYPVKVVEGEIQIGIRHS